MIDDQLNQKGLDTLKKAVKLKKKLLGKDHYSLAKTYNYMGIGYFHLQNYDLANKYYNLAIKILIKNNEWCLDLFYSYLNMGIVEAVRGKYDKAYDYFDTTRLILDSIGSEIDSLAMARFYVNYGLLATLNGRSEEGNEYFNIAESIYLKKFGPNNMNISDIYLNKGFNAFYNYDLEKTVLYYKKALDIYIANKRF
jgi:tetratricopeptide (TPR) repeat protein